MSKEILMSLETAKEWTSKLNQNNVICDLFGLSEAKRMLVFSLDKNLKRPSIIEEFENFLGFTIDWEKNNSEEIFCILIVVLNEE